MGSHTLLRSIASARVVWCIAHSSPHQYKPSVMTTRGGGQGSPLRFRIRIKRTRPLRFFGIYVNDLGGGLQRWN